MKNKKNIIITILILVAFLLGNILYLWILPAMHDKECKNRVFLEFQENKEEALRGVVGIVPESEKKGLSSHKGIGSGVLFDKKGDTYYAITAKHVLGDDSKLKIFTRDTKFRGQTINVDEGVNFEIPDEEYYQSLLDSKVEYVSLKDDLAILSFQYEKDLTLLDFDSKKINIKDKIMVIGHPEGNRYKDTYGYIKSELEIIKFQKSKEKQRLIKHDAYMKPGNSGGVALNKNKKIVGINVGGSFNILDYYYEGYMIPYDIILDNINNWRREV